MPVRVRALIDSTSALIVARDAWRAMPAPSLVAMTTADYIEKAVALAGDAERQRVLRQGLRARMASSPLCDARGLAQALEAAYQVMWQHWRESQ